MKLLKWPINKEMSDYMRMRQDQNKAACISNSNENWMRSILETRTELKWTRQASWGYRLFDFWNAYLGIAVEVDGKEHNHVIDSYRDEYNFKRSGIIVLRVRNRNEEDAAAAIDAIVSEVETWAQRRERLQCKAFGKANRKAEKAK